MSEPSPGRLTVQQVAEQLHITPDAVLKQLSRGILQGQKVKGQWQIPWPQTSEPDTSDRTDTKTTKAALVQEVASLKTQIASLEADKAYLQQALERAQSNEQAALQGAEKDRQWYRDLLQQAAIPETKALPENTKKAPWWQRLWKR